MLLRMVLGQIRDACCVVILPRCYASCAGLRRKKPRRRPGSRFAARARWSPLLSDEACVSSPIKMRMRLPRVSAYATGGGGVKHFLCPPNGRGVGVGLWRSRCGLDRRGLSPEPSPSELAVPGDVRLPRGRRRPWQAPSSHNHAKDAGTFCAGSRQDRIQGSGPIEAGTLRSRRAVFRGCVSVRQWIDAVDVVGVCNLFDGLDLLQILDARMTR